MNFETTILFIIAICLSLTLSACRDDDAEVSYNIESLKGEWLLETSTAEGFVACATEPPVLVIKDKEIDLPGTDKNGCQTHSFPVEYTFDGKAFTLDFSGTVVIMRIESHSRDRLVLEYSSPSEPLVATEVYRR